MIAFNADMAKKMSEDSGRTQMMLDTILTGIKTTAYYGNTEHNAFISLGPDWGFITKHLLDHGFKVTEEVGVKLTITW